MFDEHFINQSYESMLDRAWEEYGEERDDYDPYAEADARWESMNER